MTSSLWSRATMASAAVALACRGGSENAAPRFDVGAEYAKVTAARVRLTSARDRLDREQALHPSPSTPAQVPESSVRDARVAYDEAYAVNQKVLARFLTIALNEAPDRAETREALDSFAGDAVASARYVRDHAVDPGQTTEALGRAERAYRALGLVVPPDLLVALEEIRRLPTARPTPTPAPTSPGPVHATKRHIRKR